MFLTFISSFLVYLLVVTAYFSFALHEVKLQDIIEIAHKFGIVISLPSALIFTILAKGLDKFVTRPLWLRGLKVTCFLILPYLSALAQSGYIIFNALFMLLEKLT